MNQNHASTHRPGRRQFLMMLGAGAAASAAGWLTGCAGRPAATSQASSAGGLASFTRTAAALGSEVTMTALHPRERAAQNAVDAAFAELHLVDEVMSIYRPQSQLSLLNRDKELRNPHPALVEVLRKAELMARDSGGAFDVTVQPLWELYAAAKKEGTLPDADAIEAARAKVDWRGLAIEPGLIALRNSGASITLNGIAQGYAADRALAALRKAGVVHALVNTGEIGAIGRNAEGQPWKVGVQHPRRPEAYIALARLSGRCMSTSGDYATAFSADHAYNHIFDPATGRSPEQFSSVTIVANSATDADALSTAVFVLGPQRSIPLIEQAGAEALLVMKDGEVRTTTGFPIEA